MEAIESSPNAIKVFGRDGELSMELKEGFSYYGTGSDCPTTIDLETGRRRTCLKSDIERLSRFSDALPHIDFVMSFGIANDAPKGSNFVHQYEAMLKNTVKPIIVTAHGRNDMLTIIDMASAAIGGKKELAKRPPLILYTEPLSPLTHTEMGVNKALVCCDHDIPVIYIGSPMMGATSPVSLEGFTGSDPGPDSCGNPLRSCDPPEKESGMQVHFWRRRIYFGHANNDLRLRST
jgi:trimethylamine--corrinoid protein Co-methyltransferase